MSMNADDADQGAKGHGDIRRRYDEQLEEIRTGLVEMASLVLENTRRAGEVAIGNRLDLVDVVRAADKPINEMYAHLNDLAFHILARQQPVAVDLRFLIATTRILYEAERSGDLAVNIANRVAAHNGFPQLPAIHSLLTRLVEESCAMFALAIEALSSFDPEIGANAEAADDVVDTITTRFFGTVHAHSTEIGLDSAVELTHVGRFLERIADHGVNIAQNVTYVVTSVFPDAEDIDATG